MIRLVRRLAWLGLLALIVLSVFSAVATNNAVDESGLSYTTHPVTANQLKPSQCDSLSLTHIVIGGGTINDSNSSSLILGSSGNDTISGQGGADCILGGAGGDTLNGGDSNDVLLGGDSSLFNPDLLYGDAGNDDLYGGNGWDYLAGGSGSDSCNGGSGWDFDDGSCESTVSIP
jgi:hypothetical protein